MRLIVLKSELQKSRWALDMVVSSVVVSGLYLYIIWLTRFFEISPPDPWRLTENVLIFVSGYALSVFVGRGILKEKLSSLICVAGIGSMAIAITGVVLALPGTIKYYYQFTPEPSLARYIINDKVPALLGITFFLAVVTMTGLLVARVLRLLLMPSHKG